MDTSGRAVLFAGVTVVIAMLGQLLVGVSFLRGPAIGSSLTVLLTMIAALTLLPAVLSKLGRASTAGICSASAAGAPHAAGPASGSAGPR